MSTTTTIRHWEKLAKSCENKLYTMRCQWRREIYYFSHGRYFIQVSNLKLSLSCALNCTFSTRKMAATFQVTVISATAALAREGKPYCLCTLVRFDPHRSTFLLIFNNLINPLTLSFVNKKKKKTCLWLLHSFLVDL